MKNFDKDREKKIWREASEDLGIEVDLEFNLELPSGFSLKNIILVKYFGSRIGTLIVPSFDEIQPVLKEIDSNEYGFSVVELNHPYCRHSVIDMLKEWTWAGDESNMPSWL